MLDAMKRELDMRKDYLGSTVPDSLYFGGGTPSLLRVDEVEDLIKTVRDTFGLKSGAEINFELNPDDAEENYLSGLYQAGINRLSIGIQSFHDSELKWMNRVHNVHQSETSIELALKTGFNNFSIDLIYGIPGSDLESWTTNLKRAFDCGANHISAYNLTVEKGTPLDRLIGKGKLSGPEEGLSGLQFEKLMDYCEWQKWEHYEISNFCKPGQYSKHNTSYWKSEPYIGVGPSAHSFNGHERRWNVRHNAWYIQSIIEGSDASAYEILSRKDQFNELILTGLRTKWGVRLSKLNQLVRLEEDWRTKLQSFENQHLLNCVGDAVILTRKGYMLADRLAMELFVD